MERLRLEYKESEARVQRVAERLACYGFRKELAGEDDFTALCRASAKAEACGLGLLILGPVGVGKTCAAQALRPSHRLVSLGDSMPEDFVAPMRERKDWDAWGPDGEYVRGRLILDDAGREPVLNNYGVKTERFAEYLEWAYDRRERWCNGLPVITSNLTFSELAKRYGARIDSRLEELCVSVRMRGADKRRRYR